MKFCVRNQLSGWQRLRFLLSIVLSLPLPALAEDPAQIDRLTQQWLDIERQASHLQSDWKARQPALTQRLALLKAEKQQLQGLLEQSSASQDDVNTRRTELLAEQAELEQQQAQLAQALTLLLSRLESIASLLPPALATAWRDEQNTLSVGAETSEQLQLALAQLTRLADFDRRISVHEGTVSADDGRAILVRQLYLGTGMAWFANSDGRQAGWGQAGEDGWVWHFDDSVNADEINKAINIFEKRQAAELVRLSVRLAAQQNVQSAEEAQ